MKFYSHMYVTGVNQVGLAQKTKKVTKKTKHATEFEISAARETSFKEQIKDVMPVEQTLFLLQELDNKEDDVLLAKTKEFLKLLDRYRLDIIAGEVNFDQLQHLIHYIKKVKKGVFNCNILAILNRIETLASIEVAKASLKINE